MTKDQIQISDDVVIEKRGLVGLVEIRRPPYNFFDIDLIENINKAFKELENNSDCRAIVLASEGSAFCAGANFTSEGGGSVLGEAGKTNPLYSAGVQLFDCKLPVIAAIQGAAIGGGLGLALVADFRVCCIEARFSANFVRLGIHPGFGLTHTLPALIGQQKAALMFYTGRRINGEEAFVWGLADILCEKHKVRNEAFSLAEEIAEGAPLAIKSIKETLRQGLHETLSKQTARENDEQAWQKTTEDFKEGIEAVSEKRPAKFMGK
jgi:enoyl-CoA hydratase/carnithine racemase